MWLAAVASLVAPDRVCCDGLLGGLDHIRAEAFATSDQALLDHVYAPRSTARTADAAVIRAYERRGAHVTGADLIVMSCQVDDVAASRVRLAVIDRLAPARVVWADGTSRALPRDLPTRRTVTLVHTSEGWRIAS